MPPIQDYSANYTYTARRDWNREHSILRDLLEKEQDWKKAKPLLLRHHAFVHSAKLDAGNSVSFQDEVLEKLTGAQMRFQLQGHANTAAWMLWHIARIEDATMNVLLANSPQVFQRGKWQRKINSPTASVANEMSASEIAEWSAVVNLKTLLDYRLAVGKRTREIVEQIDFADLKDKPAPERLERLLEDGSVREQARWLLKYWGGHPKTNLLLMPATRHPFVHLNEISRMTPKLRRLVPA